MINYKIFGCPKIIVNSSFRDYINNVGLYLGLIIIIYNFISCCIFYCYVLYNITIAIYKLIPNELNLYKKIMEKNKKENNEDNKSNSQDKNKKILSDHLIQISINKNKKNKKNKKKQIMITEGEKKKKEKKINSKNSKKNKLITEFISFNNFKLNGKVSDKDSDQSIENIKNLDIEKICLEKIIINDEDVDKNEYNTLPYTQALRIDKRNFLEIFLNLIKLKIDIISIILYPEEFTHRTLLLSIYSLDFLFKYLKNIIIMGT